MSKLPKKKDTRLRFNKQEGRQAWGEKLEVRFVWFWGAGARQKVVHVQQGIDKVHSTVRSSAVQSTPSGQFCGPHAQLVLDR